MASLKLIRISVKDNLAVWAEKTNSIMNVVENFLLTSGSIVNNGTPSNQDLVVWDTAGGEYRNKTLIGPITIDVGSITTSSFSFIVNPSLITTLIEKTTTVGNDMILLYDSATSTLKKGKISSIQTSVSAAGTDTMVQYNAGGTFGASSGLTFDYITNFLTVSGGLDVNNSKLFVNSTTGRVGIGTNNPSYTLDVFGDIDSIGGVYRINGTTVLSSNTLGSNIINSSLQTLGTLSSLTVSGSATFQGTTTVSNNFYANSITSSGAISAPSATFDTLTINEPNGTLNAFRIIGKRLDFNQTAASTNTIASGIHYNYQSPHSLYISGIGPEPTGQSFPMPIGYSYAPTITFYRIYTNIGAEVKTFVLQGITYPDQNNLSTSAISFTIETKTEVPIIPPTATGHKLIFNLNNGSSTDTVIPRMTMFSSGNITMGTSTTSQRSLLYVMGTINAENTTINSSEININKYGSGNRSAKIVFRTSDIEDGAVIDRSASRDGLFSITQNGSANFSFNRTYIGSFLFSYSSNNLLNLNADTSSGTATFGSSGYPIKLYVYDESHLYNNVIKNNLIEIGRDSSGDRVAEINFHSETGTYSPTTPDARIYRAASANGALYMINRGTGGIIMSTNEAGNITLKTADVTRMLINTSSQVIVYGELQVI